MKFKVILTALAWILTLSFDINAEQNENVNKERMIKNLETMELLLIEMENEKDRWKIRSDMIQHAKLMEDAASLMVSMDRGGTLSRERCTDQKSSKTTISETCRDLESHTEVQQRMMLTLIQHLLIRQNIILRNIGILQNK